ncbi:MAG: ribonuclease H-like domain-containing protein [Desulfosalsimonadaceae bacterium]|nr:ribonuclease H-like domain-containing protein [Desulfosalsimonadaceae bacterium]
MLKNTFSHLTKIGPRREAALWENAIFSWEHLLAAFDSDNRLTRRLAPPVKQELEDSLAHFAGQNARWFAGRLPSTDTWRLFPDFRHSVAFLDIETTGLNEPGNPPDITTIALYDGKTVRWYVNGQNLNDFKQDIQQYQLLVTFNGKTFDVPVIESFFHIRMDQAHIDLRYVLKSLGYSGGLKICEQKLGIRREGLDGVDGFFAVLLWDDYRRRKTVKTLETLLAYNIEDAVNLERLMIMAFNRKISQLDHIIVERLPEPVAPLLPFAPDMATIDRIKYQRFRAFRY